MANALKWKPKDKQVRIIFGDGWSLSRVDSVESNPDKVFAVIGPFDGHMDKQDLQDALQMLLRGFNLKES